MRDPAVKRRYKKRGTGFLLGLKLAQKEHPPDLTTDLGILRDAIENQSRRAMALQREVMSQAPTVVPLRKGKAA